jgi:N-acetylneuraminic acid mutarotase
MIARRFLAAAALAWLGLGCIDVGTIPAPGPAPGSGALPLQWRKLDEPAQPSIGAMATLGHETILLDEDGTTWRWDGAWVQLHPPTSPPGRYGHAMTTVGNEVILFGGVQLDGDGNVIATPDDTWAWDGATWKRLTPPSSPPARSKHVMATLGDKVVLFGGTGATGVLNDTWEWDGATWTERTPAVSPPPRRDCAMATLGNKVVLFGGASDGATGPEGRPAGLNVMNDTWEWDGSGWTPSMALGGPEPRWGHAMATLGDKVMLFGGLRGDTSETANDTWQWDGTAWTQILPSCTTGCASDSPAPQYGAAMASREGSILLFGPGPGGGTWEWKGSQWFPRPATPKVLGYSQAAGAGLIATRRVAMAALGDRAVLWGDAAGTWEWDGAVWAPMDGSTSPPGRIGHAMAALGDQVILFGGIGLPSLDRSTVDTWQWDGKVWARLDPPTSPPWRTGAAMATLGNKVVLFGGGDSSFAPLADTWEWDGTTWTQRTPPMSPPARYEHAMATVGNEVVLFGGMGETGVLDDTWTWDGATWTPLAPASKPAARRAHAMATLDDRIVLFGGFEFDSFGLGASAHDTWAFKSGKWSQILPTEYPAERGNHAMAAVAGEVVLVGGSADLDIWLLGAPPPSPAPPLVPPLAPPPDAGGSGSGGVGGGPADAGAAASHGGGAGSGGPGGGAGSGGPGGGADSGVPGVECIDTRDCAAGLSCDVNHRCGGAGSPDAGAVFGLITLPSAWRAYWPGAA